MIRKIQAEDRPIYLKMAKNFYSSDAVQHNVPERYFVYTFDELMRSDDYAVGFILEYKNNAAGYALLAKTFSQEAGGMVLWIDELYVMPEYRGHGLAHEFFAYLKNNLQDNVKRIRLEVEDKNKKAISLYKKIGFDDLPYLQMIVDIGYR